jgi:hypothetical protein
MMKKQFLISAIILSTIMFGCRFNDSNSQSIAIQKNEAGYNFEASYPKRKTGMVIAYIENTLKEKLFLSGDGNKDIAMTLADQTKFHLKFEPGFIEIDFKKQENSFALLIKWRNYAWA